MLDRLSQWFSGQALQADSSSDERRWHLAAAILLFEVARSDHQLEETELQRLQQVLREQWSLDESALQELLQVAGREAEHSASLHKHLDVINRDFNQRQKYALLCGLWQVACADGEIHHYEEHLIRRLADLLYLPHSEFIRAKHEALGATP